MRDDIRALIDRYPPRDPTAALVADSLPLAATSFGREELEEAMESLLSGWITMGKKVAAFEEAWADYIGVSHSIAVNSGSSALLVMASAMVSCGYLKRGQEVLVPALGWSTSLFSLVQAGLNPVLVDVDAESLCIEGTRERPVLAIHLLGAPSRVQTPILLEDACGAHGAQIGNRKVGSLGSCGAFSFFFSHHLSTGEGGMITTSDPKLADACRSIRAHGWIRERSDRAQWIADHPSVDPRFLFATSGYNVRMTDIAGAMGMHQVPRLPDFVQTRRANHRKWCSWIDSLNLPLRVYPESEGTTHSAFAFPMLLCEDAPLTRAEVCAQLARHNIDTRPISGSNLARQPAFGDLPNTRVEGDTPVADAIHERGFFVGQSHAFGDDHGNLLCDALKSVFLTK